MTHPLQELLVVAHVALPALALFALAGCAWFGVGLPERATHRIVATAFGGATLASLGLVGWMLAHDIDSIDVRLGPWFGVGHERFEWRLVADRLSVPFAAFSAMLVGLIGAFSRRYLHREPGFGRFYLLLSLFGGAVELVVLAGSLDLVFFGWELVGISSALLIAYFNEREKPVEHGLRAFITYRACDIGLLSAAVWLHHSVGSSALVADSGLAAWGGLPVPADSGDALLVGLLLLWASMGKAAQVPLGGWLPRAMEGPTPSSAIFYGAISIHLGPYLLLRAAPILERSPLVAYAVVSVGALTALHATFVGRTQSDIKSALAYASMTQVGLIYVEVGLGLRYLALVHIVGHAAARSLQILRSPGLLHDHQHLERAVGSQLPRSGGHLERLVPAGFQPWLYRHALERGYFDALLRDHLVGGFRRAFLVVERVDQRFTRFSSGHAAKDAAARPADPDPEGGELAVAGDAGTHAKDAR